MRLLIICLIFAAIPVRLYACITLPKQEPNKLVHNQFFLSLLERVLTVTADEFGTCQLQYSTQDLTHKRIDYLVKQGREIDLTWAPVTIERQQDYLTINEPLVKGLLGFRIMLVKESNIDLLKGVDSIEKLKPFQFGLGYGWPDVDIYQANGLTVTQASTFEQLFKMLAAGRFPLFSRGFNEVLPEYQLHKNKKHAIDPHIVLIYPLPVYFYVNKNNHLLANRLQVGIQMLRASGEFDYIFYNDPDIVTSLKALNLERRNKIYLCNPHLPKDIPFENTSLWHFPIEKTSCQ